MGLDMYIDKCRKPIIKDDGSRGYEERQQMCYWRKNWDLFYKFPYRDEEYGKDLRLTKEDIEMVLDHVTHNKAIQKAVESYRITPEQKEYLRSLKIKKK